MHSEINANTFEPSPLDGDGVGLLGKCSVLIWYFAFLCLMLCQVIESFNSLYVILISCRSIWLSRLLESFVHYHLTLYRGLHHHTDS